MLLVAGDVFDKVHRATGCRSFITSSAPCGGSCCRHVVVIRKVHDEIKQQREQLDHLIQARDDLIHQRQKRFGDKEPEAEEQRLSAAVKLAEEAEKAVDEEVSTATQDLGHLRTKIEEWKSMASRATRLKEAEEAFLMRLKSGDLPMKMISEQPICRRTTARPWPSRLSSSPTRKPDWLPGNGRRESCWRLNDRSRSRTTPEWNSR